MGINNTNSNSNNNSSNSNNSNNSNTNSNNSNNNNTNSNSSNNNNTNSNNSNNNNTNSNSSNNNNSSQRPSPYQASVPTFAVIFSVALSVVSMQQWTLVQICATVLSPHTPWRECSQSPAVQIEAVRYSVLFASLTSVPALATGPLWGALSDRVGRRPIMLVAPLSICLGLAAVLAVELLHVGLWPLYLSHFLQGLLGGWQVGLVTLFAYFADCAKDAPAETIHAAPLARTLVFVRGEALVVLAFAFAPFLGGLLTKHLPNPAYIFVISMLGELSAIAYIICVLPESMRLPTPTSTTTLNGPGLLNVYKSTIQTITGNAGLLGVFITASLLSAAGTGKSQFFYYTTYLFAWDAYDEGKYILFASITKIIWMSLVFPLAYTLLTGSPSIREHMGNIATEKVFVTAGLCVSALISVLLAVSGESGIYFYTFFDFGVIVMPILRTLVSKYTLDGKTAQVLATMQVLEQITGIAAGVMFPLIWAASIRTFPGLFLLVCAAFYILAAIVMWCSANAHVEVIKSEDEIGGLLDDCESAENLSNSSTGEVISNS